MSRSESPQHHNKPLFQNMPNLGDEAVWDLLEMMYALIDTYEDHYAEPLRRLREKRYQELHREREYEDQLGLAFNESMDDEF